MRIRVNTLGKYINQIDFIDYSDDINYIDYLKLNNGLQT